MAVAGVSLVTLNTRIWGWSLNITSHVSQSYALEHTVYLFTTSIHFRNQLQHIIQTKQNKYENKEEIKWAQKHMSIPHPVTERHPVCDFSHSSLNTWSHMPVSHSATTQLYTRDGDWKTERERDDELNNNQLFLMHIRGTTYQHIVWHHHMV